MTASLAFPKAASNKTSRGERVREVLLHVVGAAALLTFVLTLPGCDSSAASPANSARPVKTATVHFEAAGDRTTYPGTVQPRHEGDLAFQVSGRVAKRFVDAGQQVSAGMVLAKLDDEDLRLGLRAAEAQLTSAARRAGA